MKWLATRAHENGVYYVFSNPIGWDHDTATIDLQKVRRARQFSRNSQQRRPDLYGKMVRPLPKLQSVRSAME